MKVPGKPRRVEIDFVRGIAILAVMFAHFRKPKTGIWALDQFRFIFDASGGHGVDLFFALSGFLVGGLLLREYRDTNAIKPGRFLVRRIFKIWPAYYFLIFVHLISGHHPWRGFFFQNLFHVQNYFGSTIEQTWSLAVEEHFYLLLAFLLAFVATAHWPARRVLWLLGWVSFISLTARSITAYVAFHDHVFNLHQAVLVHTELRLDSLMFGVMLALVYHFMPELYRKLSLRAWPLALLAALGWLWAIYGIDSFWVRGPGYAFLSVASGAFLMLVMEHSGRLAELRIYKAISTIGVYSYGIYLWHSAAFIVGEKIIARYPPRVAFVPAFLAQFGLALVLGYVTTRLVEWPALYWRESIPWLRDSKPLAKDPDDKIREQLAAQTAAQEMHVGKTV